jgi:hypothetical protein
LALDGFTPRESVLFEVSKSLETLGSRSWRVKAWLLAQWPVAQRFWA